jgi:hypothetical protein
MQDAANRTISLRELNWVEVDKSAREHDFLDRSPFVEYCISKEINPKKYRDKRVFEVIVMILMAVSILLLLILFLRG